MSAYRDKKTGNWVASIRYRDMHGNLQRKSKRGFRTKRDALEWERKFVEQASGSLTMPFDAFVENYIKDVSPRIKPSTLATKKCIIETHIVPYFKETPVSDITSMMIAGWQNEQLSKGFKSSYLATLNSQLTAIFNHAVKYYGLQKSPTISTDKIGNNRDAPTVDFWTLDEYREFSKAIEEDVMFFILFETLYWTGLRIGEALALTPRDIDFEAKKIKVSKTFYHLKGADYITPPKTSKSNREITIPDSLSRELESYISRIYEAGPDDRIFPTNKGTVRNKLLQACEKSRVKPIRVHDLRHSHVSLLIHMGYSAVAIADRLGHETQDITYRYAHLFPSVQEDIAHRLDELSVKNL